MLHGDAARDQAGVAWGSNCSARASSQPSAVRSDTGGDLLSDYVMRDARLRARRERLVSTVSSRRAARGAARRKLSRSSLRPPSSGTGPVCPSGNPVSPAKAQLVCGLAIPAGLRPAEPASGRSARTDNGRYRARGPVCQNTRAAAVASARRLSTATSFREIGMCRITALSAGTGPPSRAESPVSRTGTVGSGTGRRTSVRNRPPTRSSSTSCPSARSEAV